MKKIYAYVKKCTQFKLHILEKYGSPLAFLATRLYVGHFFWQSGQTKYANIDSAKELFSTEYIPNWESNHIKKVLGIDVSFPVPGVDFAAISATFGELVFSVMLMAGIGARIGAFGIFMMTLAIELFVYPGTLEHCYWMLAMALIVTAGPGKISTDYFIRKKFLEQETCGKILI